MLWTWLELNIFAMCGNLTKEVIIFYANPHPSIYPSNQTENWVGPNPVTKQEMGWFQPREVEWTQPISFGSQTKHTLRVPSGGPKMKSERIAQHSFNRIELH